VATVSKQWFTFTDTYGVDVAAGEDDVLILASSVVIDMALPRDGKPQMRRIVILSRVDGEESQVAHLEILRRLRGSG